MKNAAVLCCAVRNWPQKGSHVCEVWPEPDRKNGTDHRDKVDRWAKKMGQVFDCVTIDKDLCADHHLDLTLPLALFCGVLSRLVFCLTDTTSHGHVQ